MSIGVKIHILGKVIISLGLISPIVFYAYQHHQRPPRQEISQPLFQGMDYQRLILAEPRPNVLHIVTVDLSVPGISPRVSMSTPAKNADQPHKISVQAQTVSEFVHTSGVQIGMNGNYFYEFREKTPWDFYPQTGDPVYTVGDAISQGDRYGSPRDIWPALCFFAPVTTSITDHPADDRLNTSVSIATKTVPETYRAHIAPAGHCPPHTAEGLAGRDLLIADGQPLKKFPNIDNDKAYSRAAIGINQTGDTLWMVIIDGKQPGYSEGLLLYELADVFTDLGVHEAIALDGGGSSTLAIESSTGPQLLNTPMHVKWPHQERPIANHLGFYALPLHPMEDNKSP